MNRRAPGIGVSAPGQKRSRRTGGRGRVALRLATLVATGAAAFLILGAPALAAPPAGGPPAPTAGTPITPATGTGTGTAAGTGTGTPAAGTGTPTPAQLTGGGTAGPPAPNTATTPAGGTPQAVTTTATSGGFADSGGDGNGGADSIKATTSACGTPATDAGSTQVDPNSSEGSAASIVGQGAIAAMCWTLSRIDIGTSPQVAYYGGTGWFDPMYTMFRGIGLWVVIPLLCMATIHAVFKGSLQLILKTFLVYLPISVVAGATAVGIVQLLLNMTDDFSKGFINSISAESVRLFAGISDGFGIHGAEAAVPYFVMIIVGLMLMFACIGVYVILVMREASVYLATAFIPLTLAFLVWPSTAHFFKKLAEFLFGMIISKLVMVAAIALAVAAMASTTGADAAAVGTTQANGGPTTTTGVTAGTTGSGTEPWWTWLGQTMTTTIMFTLVIFAPNMTVKVISKVALPNMGHHVASHHNRPPVQRHIVFAERLLTTGTGIKGIFTNEAKIKRDEERAASTYTINNAMEKFGAFADGDGSYEITPDAIAASPLSLKPAEAAWVYHASRATGPQAAKFVAASQVGFLMDAAPGVDDAGNMVFHNPAAFGGAGQHVVLGDMVNGANQLNNGMDPAAAARSVETILRNGGRNITLLVPYDGVMQDGGHGGARLAGSGAFGAQETNAKLIDQRLDVLREQYPTANIVFANDATTTVDSHADASQYRRVN